MSNQKYWDKQLTPDGRREMLMAIGRDQRYRSVHWSALPSELQRQLVRKWGDLDVEEAYDRPWNWGVGQ